MNADYFICILQNAGEENTVNYKFKAVSEVCNLASFIYFFFCLFFEHVLLFSR